MNNSPVIESFITFATFEIRFMPAISMDAGLRLANLMLKEVQENGSPGAEAHVHSDEESLSVAIESVELYPMTIANYGRVLSKLEVIAKKAFPD